MKNETMDLFSMLISGFGTDVLVVLLSALLPLLVGIGLTVLMHFTRKSALLKVFRYVAIATEGLVPTVILFTTFFSVPRAIQNLHPLFRMEPLSTAVIALSICFLGYMVFRYEERDSLIKNLVVNGIGLVADLFKWCVAVVAVIGVQDVLGAAKLYVGRTYNITGAYSLVLLISSVVLVTLYLVRQLCKDLMK